MSRFGLDECLDGPWLDGLKDQACSMRSLQQQMELADICDNGDCKLILTNSREMKIFRSSQMIFETRLPDSPVSCLALRQSSLTKIPSIVVACGSQIFVYRQLRPHLKFSLPSVVSSEEENSIWSQLREEKIEKSEAKELLSQLKCRVSRKTLSFLATDEFDESPLADSSEITCCCRLKVDENIDCLVCGTELSEVLILETTMLHVQVRIEVSSVPCFVVSRGDLKKGYEIFCATRFGEIVKIENDLVVSRLELDSYSCGICSAYNRLYSATADRSLSAYENERLLFSLKLSHRITNIESLEKVHLKGCLLCVQPTRTPFCESDSSEIHLYVDRDLCHVLKLGEPVYGMKFGSFARELGVLLLSLNSGSLSIKILHRQSIQRLQQRCSEPTRYSIDLPEKSEVYLESVQRQQERAEDLHKIFVRDLESLEEVYLKAFCQQIAEENHVSLESENWEEEALQLLDSTSSGPVKLRLVDVLGQGPKFTVCCEVENRTSEKLDHLSLMFLSSPMLYYEFENGIQEFELEPSERYLGEAKIFVRKGKIHEKDEVPETHVKCLVFRDPPEKEVVSPDMQPEYQFNECLCLANLTVEIPKSEALEESYFSELAKLNEGEEVDFGETESYEKWYERVQTFASDLEKELEIQETETK